MAALLVDKLIGVAMLGIGGPEKFDGIVSIVPSRSVLHHAWQLWMLQPHSVTSVVVLLHRHSTARSLVGHQLSGVEPRETVKANWTSPPASARAVCGVEEAATVVIAHTREVRRVTEYFGEAIRSAVKVGAQFFKQRFP